MILPITFLLELLDIFTTTQEVSLDLHEPVDNQKENDDLYKDLEDLFI